MQKSIDIPKAIIIGAIIISIGLAVGLRSGTSDKATEYASPDNAVLTTLTTQAEAVGVKKSAFLTCMDDKKLMQKINEDEKLAMDQGTPYSVAVGPKQTLSVSGALPFPIFKELVTRMATGEIFDVPTELQKYVMAADALKINSNDHVRGNPDAPVTIFEFSDIDCPFCASIHPTLKKLTTEHSEIVSWVYRHRPLDDLHPHARTKALASECVASLAGNDAFWKFIDDLFANR